MAFLQNKHAFIHKITANMQDENWDDLRVVLGVARTQSFAGAARRLGVNESTVARRIAGAERRMCALLFERTRSGLIPTHAGAQIIQQAEAIELEIQAVQARISGMDEQVAGTVRITSVPIIVNHVLAPALPELLTLHPFLNIELIADQRDFSLTKREADIALRLARPQKEIRAIARKVGNFDYAVYEQAGRTGDNLPWINYEDSMSDLPHSQWISEYSSKDADLSPRVQVNDTETILHCIKSGLGKSLLPLTIGENEPELQRLDGYPETVSRELWLMVHPDLRDLARVRAVMDWITGIVDF